MHFTKIELQNWRNFREVAVELPSRAFLIGPNASGKSNFLDVFRFLRDLASSGLQSAVEERGGVQKLRSLHARNPADIRIKVELGDDEDIWSYELAFTQEGKLPRQGKAVVKREIVRRNNDKLVQRPDSNDTNDPRLLEQTALEQLSRNQAFRSLADHFALTAYLHLVPQMIRRSRGLSTDTSLPDIYGGSFLETVANTSEGRRKRYLNKIEEVLRIAVPQLKELKLEKDSAGRPHLEALYDHWRPNAGRQDESQFSDGTLRLIGLLWALQDGTGLLLMEEPELSLHSGIVRQLAPFIFKAQTRSKNSVRQTFISTHSVELLSDEGIAPTEVLLFRPGESGTKITVAAGDKMIRASMDAGLTAAEAALPSTTEAKFMQLSLLDL